MLTLDHLTVIAPTLTEGVEHVRDCLGIEVPFGTRHDYMGTHNHRLQLGKNVYLKIVALDPSGVNPGRSRWFGVDDPRQVRSDWERGRRLRGWVAAIVNIESFIRQRPQFGEVVNLPFNEPKFAFAIPVDGYLPLGGILPSLIDHRSDPTRMSDIPDFGARLTSFSLEHPEPEEIRAIYDGLTIDRPPEIKVGEAFRYEVEIATPSGRRSLW
ncbi:VOC family protein [uncultured Roseovarius sp.]|uniref:VOC family protein n=1 Tax=uncultured Roseovarius sp. TaxID=293344 RepID=UPI0026220DE5|nr:VOC family protein [uncultured Roseovarius sp.]